MRNTIRYSRSPIRIDVITMPYAEIMFFFALPLVIYYFIVLRSLSQRMKKKHYELYLKYEMDAIFIGKPEDRFVSGLGVYIDNRKSVNQLLKFLFGNKYKPLKDRTLTKICSRLKLIFITVVSLLVLVFISLIYDFTVNSENKSTATYKSAAHKQAYELHKNDQFEEAIKSYNNILENDKTDSEVLYWRAMAYWILNKHLKASRDFHRVIRLEPDNFKAHKYADQLMSRDKRWDDIIELWGRYIDHVPDNAEAYMERGGAHHHAGNRDSSIRDAIKACQLGLEKACTKVEQMR